MGGFLRSGGPLSFIGTRIAIPEVFSLSPFVHRNSNSRDVQRQIFGATFLEAADNAALEVDPKALIVFEWIAAPTAQARLFALPLRKVSLPSAMPMNLRKSSFASPARMRLQMYQAVE